MKKKNVDKKKATEANRMMTENKVTDETTDRQ